MGEIYFLECLSANSIPRIKKRTVSEATPDAEVVEVPAEKKSPKRSRKRHRRSRFKRKSASARKEAQTVEISEPENEETNRDTEGGEGLFSGNGDETGETVVFNGHDGDVLADCNQTQNKEIDVDSVRTLRFVCQSVILFCFTFWAFHMLKFCIELSKKLFIFIKRQELFVRRWSRLN